MTNDNYYDRSEYSQITWQEVRKDDVLMHANGDRLTVNGFEGLQIRTFAGLYAPSEYQGTGFTPYRRKPEVPTVHLDKDGDVWVREDNGTDSPWWCGNDGFLYTHQEAAEFAPFTRLVPMPTREQVEELGLYGPDVDAVMALLRGDNNA